MLLFKNKLFHPFSSFRMSYLVIILLVVFVVFSSFYTKRTIAASSTGGHDSLLFSMLVDEDEEIIEYADDQIDDFALPTDYLQEEPALGQIIQIGPMVVEEEEAAALVEGGSALIKTIIILDDPEVSKRDELVEYVVQGGDTVSTIAKRFGITTNSILWANSLSYYDYIKPGQKLNIPPTSGVLHKVVKGETLSAIVKKYSAELEKTVEFNKLGSAHNIKIGDMIMVPDGQPPRSSAARYSKAVAYVSNIVPPSASVPAGSAMLWPTTSKTSATELTPTQ